MADAPFGKPPATRFLEEEIARLSKARQSVALPKLPESLDQSAFRRTIDSFMSARLPEIPEFPIYEPVHFPTHEEVNDYQSAGVLLRQLASTITAWRTTLPDSLQPGVLALLQGGIQIQVLNLTQVSFHGIQIDGLLNGKPCVLLSHQANVQLLCFAEEVAPPEAPRRQIGFIIDGTFSVA